MMVDVSPLYTLSMFWHGTIDRSLAWLLVPHGGLVIPMTLILVSYCLLPMRGRILFWVISSLALVAYAVWLAESIGA